MLRGGRPRAQTPEPEERRIRPLAHYLWLRRTPQGISPASGPGGQTRRLGGLDLSGHTSGSLSPRNTWPWRASSPTTPTAPCPMQALAPTGPPSLPYPNSPATVHPHHSRLGGVHTRTHTRTLAHTPAPGDTLAPLSVSLCVQPGPDLTPGSKMLNHQKEMNPEHPQTESAHGLVPPCGNILHVSFMEKMTRTTSRALEVLWARQKLPP